MRDPVFWRWLRWLYGAYFIVLGVASVLQYLGVLADPHWERARSPASATFYAALERTGFVTDLIILTWVTSGLAMLFNRTAPLGIVLLTPFIVNMFLADTVLDDAWLWATAHAAPLVALAWHYRSAYFTLWNYSGSPIQALKIGGDARDRPN